MGTADLLDMLIAQEPDSDFTLALGADTFLDLTDWKWRRSKDVIELVGGRILVIYRILEENFGEERAFETRLQRRLELLNKECWEPRKDGNGHGTVYDCSGLNGAMLIRIPSLSVTASSLVRCTVDEASLSTMLTPKVLAYIKQKKMYAFGNGDGCAL